MSELAAICLICKTVEKAMFMIKLSPDGPFVCVACARERCGLPRTYDGQVNHAMRLRES